MAIKYLSINSETLDISNILTKDIPYIIDSYQAQSGKFYMYRKWSNGFIEQWKEVDCVNGSTLITLDIPFTNAQYCIVTGNKNYNHNPAGSYGAYHIISKTQFYITGSVKNGTDSFVIYASGF